MEGIPDINPFRVRLKELDAQMQASDFYNDQKKAARVGREHQKITYLIELYESLVKLENDIKENENLIKDAAGDPDLQGLAREELEEAYLSKETLKKNILLEMIPPDPSDSRNTIVEIRAGAGGDEASLFAGVLYRMYTRFAETEGWKVEGMSSSPSECGGFKEVSFLVSGEEVYKKLKYESGVHRVQRVPVTEASGRVHTSTATVAVLPEAEEVDIEIKPEDLEITACKASGPGGQGVNTTDSAIQLLHKPTGTMIYCADERSQLKNRLKAMAVLRARLLKAKQEEEQSRYAQNRRAQIGSGDRSERIRTYNFPQNRLTDHRINLTLYSLPQIVEGALEELIKALQEADEALKVKELIEQDISS